MEINKQLDLPLLGLDEETVSLSRWNTVKKNGGIWPNLSARSFLSSATRAKFDHLVRQKLETPRRQKPDRTGKNAHEETVAKPAPSPATCARTQ